MNHVCLIGRMVKEPEIRYSQGATPMAVAKFTLAVNRQFKREGEPDCDFIPCTCFGKTAEFVEKYMNAKGQQIAVNGSIQVRSYEDKEGQKRWSTDVIVNNVYFADSKKQESNETNTPPQNASKSKPKKKEVASEFVALTDSIDDDDLPF